MHAAPNPAPGPLPTDLSATIRDEEGSSTVADLEGYEAPPPRIDKSQPGAIGQQRYAIEALIGRGATSQVFAADDLVFDRRIAIKFLSGNKVADPKRIGRFMREAKLTAALEHPNIAPIYDLDFTQDGDVYFSMRMIGGSSMGRAIQEALDGRPSPVATPYDVVNILLRVCEAVSCAHGKGILHRDIKPDNVMLGAFGEVVLVDWGSAITADETEGRQGRLVGTPIYMSPEQARGEPADARSDVYCLGTTLFHGLTRRVPTSAGEVPIFWAKKRAGTIDPPTAAERLTLPPALLDIALMAMAVEPGDRYQTVDELAGDLRRWQAGLAVSAHRESTWERLRRWHRQHGRVAWATAIVLTAVLGSGAILYGERLKEIATWGLPTVSETFADETWKGRWLVATGGFAVRDGRLVSTASNDSTAFFSERLGGGIAIEYDGQLLPDSAPGDLSVIWSEEEPKAGLPSHQYPFRFRIQVGAYDNSFAQIEEAGGLDRDQGKTRLSYNPFFLESGRTYRMRIEIEPERITLLVDGEVVCATDLDVPIGMGYVGLYAYYPGKAFDNLRVYAKGVPERISSLALGDRDMREGLFMRAALQYAQVAHAHPGRAIADEARYRQGYALTRIGDHAEAERIWAQVRDPQRRRLIGLQRLNARLTARDFPAVMDGIRAYAGKDPDLRLRLARLWAVASDLIIKEPEPMREEMLAIYDQHLQGALAGGDAVARLLNSLDRHDEVLQRFPKLPVENSEALIALGRAEEVERRFPTNRFWVTRALLAQGRFDEAVAVYPPIRWARHQVLRFRDQPLPDVEFMDDGHPDRLLRKGEAQRLLDQQPRSGEYMRALIFLDRFDEALREPVRSYWQRQWRMIAACLAGREDIVRADMAKSGREAERRCAFWLGLRTCAAGDLAGGRAALDAIVVPAGWFDSGDLFFAHGFLRPFVAAIAGDRKPFAAALEEYSTRRKNTFEQRLWYAAEYIAGRMDDETFLAQPVVIQRVGFLAFCRALRAEWEGRTEAAAEAYRAYLALPPHQRLLVWNERDPSVELFAAWRAAALAPQPER